MLQVASHCSLFATAEVFAIVDTTLAGSVPAIVTSAVGASQESAEWLLFCAIVQDGLALIAALLHMLVFPAHC